MAFDIVFPPKVDSKRCNALRGLFCKLDKNGHQRRVGDSRNEAVFNHRQAQPNPRCRLQAYSVDVFPSSSLTMMTRSLILSTKVFVRSFIRSCPLGCFHYVDVLSGQLRRSFLALYGRKIRVQNRSFSRGPRKTKNSYLFTFYRLTISLQLIGSCGACTAL